jgi:predicted enzyme related to lactoylglutathione lyase
MLKPLLAGLTALVLLAGCVSQDGSGEAPALTDAPKYGKFVWHDLITDDPAAARDFYSGLLGWSFERANRPSGGSYTLILSEQGRYVGGLLNLDDPDDGEDFSRWLGYLAVPDVDEAARTLADAGGDVVAHPRDVGIVARAAAVQDPDGALIGLVTSRIGYPIDRIALDRGDVAWNELVTADAATAAPMYASLVAGSVREERRGENLYHYLRNEGRDRAGVMTRPDERITPFWLTYFAVPDVSAAVSRVAELGGTVLLAPDPSIRRGTVALVTDPTGAVLGLKQEG